MSRRWGNILILSILLLLPVIWLSSESDRYLEKLSHKEHPLFAVQLQDARGKIQEVECWANPYLGYHFCFLPSYGREKGYRLCLNEGEMLRVGEELLKSGDLLEDRFLEEDVRFTLLRRDGSAIEGMLDVMGDSELPALFIETEYGTLDQIRADKEYKEKGSYYLTNGDGTEAVGGDLEYMAGRGNITWEMAKKPYKLKLSKKQDLLGMGEGDSWVLLANYNDGSYMRNKLVFDLAEEIGLSYTPESAFVDLYVNGVYEGLYQLTEKIEVGESRVAITDLEEENQKINSYHRELGVFEEENRRGIRWKFEPEDITGGYLLESEMSTRYGTETSGFVTEQGQAVVLKSPDKASYDQVEYISFLVQEFEDALYAKDGRNPNNGKSYTEYIDLESWAKKYLIEEITKNLDAGISSQYFYKESDVKGDSQLYAGPVWDYDWALGNGDLSVRDPEGLLANQDMRLYLPGDTGGDFRNRWFPKLYEKEEFLAEVRKQYEECAAPAVRMLAEQRIDTYRCQIEGAASMNQARWFGEAASILCVNFDTLEEHTDYIKNFMMARLDFLDTVWIDNLDSCTVCFKTAHASRNYYYEAERGEALKKVPHYEESADGLKFEGWYYDEACTQPFDREAPILDDLELYALWIPE